LKASTTQKCQFHGGRGSGPKTAGGKARIAAAHTVTGRETKKARAERSRASAQLLRLEDAMHLLKMTTAARTRGRKPRGYTPIRSSFDLIGMVRDGSPQHDSGAGKPTGKN